MIAEEVPLDPIQQFVKWSIMSEIRFKQQLQRKRTRDVGVVVNHPVIVKTKERRP
jgi:hypothetical protein